MGDSAYDPVLSSKAACFLVSLNKRRQRGLIQLLEQLARYPSQIGDYSLTDDTDRDVQFLLLGDYLIAYWPDHAVREFRIVDIEEV